MSSTRMTIQGIDSLVDKLETMGRAGKTAANKALREAGAVIVKQQQIDGPRHKGGPANGKNKHGADALKVGKIRTAKASKNKYVQIGITDREVWEYAKGVYFQHHGFYNHRTKRYVAGSQWFNKSFEKSKNRAASILKQALERELKL